jgi:hypothetical protein
MTEPSSQLDVDHLHCKTDANQQIAVIGTNLREGRN